MTPQTRRLLIAALGALLIGAVLAVLYVSFPRPVHAVHPTALAKLKMDEKPTAVPAVAFSDAVGARHNLTEFRGRYMLLNLWATWCAPCVKELPALSHLQAAIGAKKLAVVPVNVGRGTAADTATFLKQHQAVLPVYLDTNSAFLHAFGAYGLPLTVLIDPQGREIARAIGGVKWDAPEAIAYFKSLTQPGGHS
jgi:thiol-disulfide isomerase/thioredoxin